jgi:hypothetical protein
VVHAAPTLVTVSHLTPHAVQFVIVLSGVSQPFKFGPVIASPSQSP